ncbi:unnamed protein product [Cuscuta epithymum]|uniref:Zinc finger, CCHC-type n=1 Tax=Cuscuta epithymum TaxID=186058 RepID=A0AAV0GJY3_9ASTE|nr:unnamed protein product [Cuscuta epithymum]
MAATLRDINTNFQKLEKFEGVEFRRWQKKMHFLLTTLKVVYVLSTLRPPEDDENEALETSRRRIKWDNDDYICRGHILNGMCDSLFDVYQNVEFAKTLWELLESKYMTEDASSKKFLISNFNSYKMVDSRPVMEQFHEIQRLYDQLLIHNMHVNETFAVGSIIDKLPLSWKEVKNSLKRKKEDLSMEQLGRRLQIEEDIKLREGDNGKKNDLPISSINVMEEGQSSGTKKKKRSREIHQRFQVSKEAENKKVGSCWECGGPHFKRDCLKVKKKKKAQSNGHPNGGQDNQG